MRAGIMPAQIGDENQLAEFWRRNAVAINACSRVSHGIQCYPMNTLNSTPEFESWLIGMTDKIGKARIIQRLDSASLGNFGDCESVGDGVSEMRIHYGPGYRVYFSRIGGVVYLLLIGGDKSTQKRDIKKAKQILASLGEE